MGFYINGFIVVFLLNLMPPVHSHVGFCKQLLWPLFHYILPVAASSSGRFDLELWQAYVKANKVQRGEYAQEQCNISMMLYITPEFEGL